MSYCNQKVSNLGSASRQVTRVFVIWFTKRAGRKTSLAASRLDQGPRGRGDAQDSGENHHPQAERPEGCFGDPPQESRADGLADHGRRYERGGEWEFFRVDQPANGEDDEGHDAHEEEVEGARPSKLVLGEVAGGQQQDYWGTG